MTTSSTVVDFSSFTTDAKFRTWGAACKAGLAAAGFVQTSDTGQIDWTTVTKPVATNTVAGYEIWRFADALQATKPIYFKVSYGSGGVASGNSPSATVQVGTGSNGTGTITGNNVTSAQGYSGSTAPANTTGKVDFCFVSSIGYGLLNFGYSLNSTGTLGGIPGGIFIIERSKDSSGAATGSAVGLTAGTYASSLTWNDRSVNFDTATTFATNRPIHCGAPNVSYSLASGADVPLYRHYIGAGILYRAIGRLSYYGTDIADGTTFSTTAFGSTAHTYRAWTPGGGADSSGSAAISLAWIWE